MTRLTLSALMAFTSLTLAASGALAQDVDLAAGKSSFNKCLACHAIGEGAKNKVGPELTGLDLIRELVASTAAADRPQILLMTAHATVESAIEAMKLGALDYLQKPFEIDELLVVVRRALDHGRLRTD